MDNVSELRYSSDCQSCNNAQTKNCDDSNVSNLQCVNMTQQSSDNAINIELDTQMHILKKQTWDKQMYEAQGTNCNT